jgi:hypothetical protein
LVDPTSHTPFKSPFILSLFSLSYYFSVCMSLTRQPHANAHACRPSLSLICLQRDGRRAYLRCPDWEVMGGVQQLDHPVKSVAVKWFL